jgi:hypothetical protein
MSYITFGHTYHGEVETWTVAGDPTTEDIYLRFLRSPGSSETHLIPGHTYTATVDTMFNTPLAILPGQNIPITGRPFQLRAVDADAVTVTLH